MSLGRRIRSDRIFPHHLAGLEVALTAFAKHYGRHVVFVADDHAQALMPHEGVQHAGIGGFELAELDLAREEVEVDLGGVAAAVGGHCCLHIAGMAFVDLGSLLGQFFALLGHGRAKRAGRPGLLHVGQFAGHTLQTHSAGVAAD